MEQLEQLIDELESEVARDLSMEGDDARDLIAEFSKGFSVDMSSFPTEA